MLVHCDGEATIKHSETGVEYSIQSDQLDWHLERTIVRELGTEQRHYAQLEHPQLGTLAWNLWEYPLGTESDALTDVGDHEIIHDLEYYLEWDEEERAGKIEELVSWFHENYEDPAERTPYESREGGYQWIWGGPYDAREELEDQFPETPEEIIEAAVAEIEGDGLTEWAPVSRPEDYDDFDERDEGPDEDEIEVPNQEPGPSFALLKTGQIGVLPTGFLEEQEAVAISDLRSGIVEALEVLVPGLSGSNAYGPLVPAVTTYDEVIRGAYLSIDRLYACGIRLENSFRRVSAEIQSGELPELPSHLGEALDSVLAMHGPLLLSTVRGQELLDRARQYSNTVFETENYRQAARQITNAIANSGLLNDEAVEQLSSSNNEQDADHPERSAHVSHTANRNILITVAKQALGIGVAAVLGNGLAASGLGLEATEVVTHVVNNASTFFLQNAHLVQEFVAISGPDMGWLDAVLRKISQFSKS